MKKRLVVVLALVLVCGLLVVAFATSGKCGDEAKWRYNLFTGTLTISGKGEMDDYSVFPGIDSRPYKWYVDKTKNIIIENGITSIGQMAFKNCENLKSITIPDSVTEDGFQTFAGCTSLVTIYGETNSYAEVIANYFNLKFELLSN